MLPWRLKNSNPIKLPFKPLFHKTYWTIWLWAPQEGCLPENRYKRIKMKTYNHAFLANFQILHSISLHLLGPLFPFLTNSSTQFDCIIKILDFFRMPQAKQSSNSQYQEFRTSQYLPPCCKPRRSWTFHVEVIWSKTKKFFFKKIYYLVTFHFGIFTFADIHEWS